VKTLGEIAIEAGLVNRASAARAGRMAEERKQPLVVVLIRELGVDEVALVGALRKQTRVPLIDPAAVEIDPEALRQLPRDVCARLRVLPLSLTTDGEGKLLRIAMADPTDTSAIAEIEQLTHCDVEVNALPLSAIDELVDHGYRQVNTAVVPRMGASSSGHLGGATMFVTSRGRVVPEPESEVSETAQISFAALHATGPHDADDLEARLSALISVLVAKGVLTEVELVEALRKGKP
jgi:Type II secretion system (T2SS), protein E, N-terminal domain